MIQKNSTAQQHGVNFFIFTSQNKIMKNDRYKYKKL